jgi:DNA-binding transcriptional ArsR family regulator
MSTFRDCILRSLSMKYGWSTSDIATGVGRQPGAETDDLHRAAIRRELRALERDGLVCRMDDEYPIAWMLTDKAPT